MGVDHGEFTFGNYDYEMASTLTTVFQGAADKAPFLITATGVPMDKLIAFPMVADRALEMVVPRAIKEDDRILIVMVANDTMAMVIAVTIRDETLVLTAEKVPKQIG